MDAPRPTFTLPHPEIIVVLEVGCPAPNRAGGSGSALSFMVKIISEIFCLRTLDEKDYKPEAQVISTPLYS